MLYQFCDDFVSLLRSDAPPHPRQLILFSLGGNIHHLFIHIVKIVGIGLNKTGTKTLGECMRCWNMKHISFSANAFDYWRNNDAAAIMRLVEEYDSFEDWPWPLIYKGIDEAFPEAKFILTTRQCPDVWFDSLCRHAERHGPTIFRKLIYGFEMPHSHKREHIHYYEAHTESVRGYFGRNPSKLLEVCWENGDGWEELSNFLALPSPDIPFPNANKSPG